MSLMFEEGIRGGMCQATHRLSTVNNKYMKEYNKNIISSYLHFLDANNLYGWAMCKKLPIGEFKWSKPKHHTEEKMKNQNQNSEYGIILEADVGYLIMIKIKHRYLQLLPEKMKINGTNKLVTTRYDKERYVIHISASKQALNHGLKLKKVHRAIMFRQEAWLKPYIDMNTKLRTDATSNFEKNFFKLMNNSVLGKTMENVRNQRDIKLVTTNEKKRKYVSEPNYHISKYFSEDLMAIETRKTSVTMNKPLYLGQAILDISKDLMYEFWYDFIVPKYGDKATLNYMDTDSFIIHIETEDLYKDIANDVMKWFETSKYNKEVNRSLPIGKNKKVIGMFKDELDGMIMTENAND